MSRPAKTQDAVISILDALRRMTRYLRLADRQIEQRLGISGAQLFILQHLGRGPARSVNQLAHLTYTHQSSVSVVVSRLVERGLAARRQSAEDARRVELRITPLGQQLLRRSPVTPQARLIAALQRMPPASSRKLAELLNHMVREMGADTVPASMFFEDERPRTPRATRQSRGRSDGRGRDGRE